MKTAILVVDMLEDFFSPEMTPDSVGRERAWGIVPALQYFIYNARQYGVPIVYVNDSFTPAEAKVDAHLRLFGRHAVRGTPGAEVVEALAPKEEDYVVSKKVYDGFYDTRLDMLLRELGINTIVVTGIWVNCCVKHTVAGGWFRRYRTVLPVDCTAAKKEEDKIWAIEYMKRYYETRITSSKELLKEFADTFHC